MGTDRLDSLLIHRPNPLMSAKEISEAVVKLVDSGKILNFGEHVGNTRKNYGTCK